ncbi:mCG1027168, partial [Mus musculus]
QDAFRETERWWPVEQSTPEWGPWSWPEESPRSFLPPDCPAVTGDNFYTHPHHANRPTISSKTPGTYRD